MKLYSLCWQTMGWENNQYLPGIGWSQIERPGARQCVFLHKKTYFLRNQQENKKGNLVWEKIYTTKKCLIFDNFFTNVPRNRTHQCLQIFFSFKISSIFWRFNYSIFFLNSDLILMLGGYNGCVLQENSNVFDEENAPSSVQRINRTPRILYRNLLVSMSSDTPRCLSISCKMSTSIWHSLWLNYTGCL